MERLRKSHNTGAQLSYMGHVLMEHRSGWCAVLM